MKYLENLARRYYEPDADKKVKEELTAAGIPVLSLMNSADGEVKTYYIGLLNGFIFQRAWKYWVVKGNMPLDVAEYIYYNHKELEIRAAGDAGNPNPRDFAVDPIYKKYCREQYKNGKNPDKTKKEYQYNPRYIQMYHIDTEEGLKVFADTVKKFNVTTEYIE